MRRRTDEDLSVVIGKGRADGGSTEVAQEPQTAKKKGGRAAFKVGFETLY